MFPTLLDALTLRLAVEARSLVVVGGARLRRDQRGEGVISAAIAVLVMAFLGVLLYTLFTQVLQSAGDRTNDTVGQIGGA